MKSIWKFVFELKSGIQQLDMPADSVVLAFADNQGLPTIWALVDRDKPSEKRTFHLKYTGDTFNRIPGRYIGTAQFQNDNYILHCFEETS